MGPYLSAADAFGSPADDLFELGEAPETARIEADQLNAEAEHLSPISVGSLPTATGSPPQLVAVTGARPIPTGKLPDAQDAQRAGDRRAAAAGVTLRPRPARPEALGLRRFATSFPLSFELRAPAVVLIPDDGSARPWHALLRGPGPVTLCGLSASPG